MSFIDQRAAQLSSSPLELEAEFLAAQNNLKRKTLVRVGIVSFVCLCVAGVLLFVYSRTPPFPTISKPLLWKVERPATSHSYLFGTMHIGFSIEDLPEIVLQAQDECVTTVTEGNMISKLTKEDVLLDEPDANRLESEDWQALSEITGKSQGTLERVQTGHLIGLLLTTLVPRKREAMDRGLQQRAMDKKKNIVFLEDSRKNVSDGQPDRITNYVNEDAILKMLKEAVHRPGQARAEMMQMIRNYASGELISDVGDTNKQLLDGLNDVWFEQIVIEVQRGSAFIAIGNAHLNGANSVINRLRNKGFKVTRVNQ